MHAFSTSCSQNVVTLRNSEIAYSDSWWYGGLEVPTERKKERNENISAQHCWCLCGVGYYSSEFTSIGMNAMYE